jgi:hypothetical protein
MSDPPKPSPPAPSPAASPSDDEFAGVRARRARHPVLAIAATLLVAYLVFHVRKDVRYSLSSKEPLEMGDARALFASGRSLDDITNRYVRVRGTPDRESALELDTKGSWTFTQFFRVLGTGGRLFVHRRESPVPAFRAEEDVFEGRLIRFQDLSFQSSIRRYFASHVTSTHFFPPEGLRRVIAAAAPGSPITIHDVGGDAVTLAPNDLVALDETDPDLVRIAIPKSRARDEAAARAEIEKRGGVVVAVAPPAASPGVAAEQHAFLVRFPAERKQMALHEIGDIDRKVQIRDVRRTHKVRVADLADDNGAAFLLKEAGGKTTRIPLATVAAIRTLATVQIPDDAYLLIEGDHPRDHLHLIAVVGVLALFAAVNLGGLLRGMRR